MPEFSTPFSVKHSDRKLTNEELIRAIKYSIAAEYEASQIYEQLAESTDYQNAKIVLQEVSDDEKVHVGCFKKLLDILYPEGKEFEKQGEEEISVLLNQKTSS